jgi:hypothetical protein
MCYSCPGWASATVRPLPLCSGINRVVAIFKTSLQKKMKMVVSDNF